ncbi:hypothetical protein PRIPAC_70944, partial [Pristionchus pacificus]|uniref:F-box domain-containing protein n=1 Tax=Pristionchus pacificus TaxID=54126 RepID=A0A2A6C0T0_PRIPA
MVEFLYLPLEMICEVVKFVDNNGLLALRKVNRITRDAVDNVCRSMQIQNIYVYDFVFVICPTEDFPEAMKALHGAIKRCPIDNFTFNCKYKNEAVITITDRFLDGLNVKKERCLYACDFSKDESHADKFPLEGMELPKLRKKVYFKARIREDRNDAFSISDVNRALGFHAFLLNGFTDPVNGYIEISDGNITVD